MITKNGLVKRTPLSAYAYQRKGGKKALTLAEGDELVAVFHTTGENELVIATRNGLAVHFPEADARCVGRTARGVRGIRLGEGDYVVGAAIANPDQMVVTITEKGFGKRCAFDQFPIHRRGGKGVFCQKLSEKAGHLTGIAAVSEDDDLMMMTDDGIMIRTPVAGIPVYSRTANGVIVMRLAEGSTLLNFARVEVLREEDVEKAEADAALIGTDEDLPEESGEELSEDIVDEVDETEDEDPTEGDEE
jgi:DNA gyrase subunit A